MVIQLGREELIACLQESDIEIPKGFQQKLNLQGDAGLSRAQKAIEEDHVYGWTFCSRRDSHQESVTGLQN
jgi:hypothetical protein